VWPSLPDAPHVAAPRVLVEVPGKLAQRLLVQCYLGLKALNLPLDAALKLKAAVLYVQNAVDEVGADVHDAISAAYAAYANAAAAAYTAASNGLAKMGFKYAAHVVTKPLTIGSTGGN
jgi:hypothetical protein